MQNRDSFDDPATDGIFSNIARALAARHDFSARRPLWAGAMALATLAVLAAVLYYAYPREAALQELAAAPIIRADANPIKIDPDNPGGMEIPHRQSVVYDALGHGERRIENLLPPAEEPLPRDELFAGLKTELPDPVVMQSEPVAQEIDTAAAEDMPPQPAVKPAAVKTEAPAPTPTPTPVETTQAAKTEPAAGTLTAKAIGNATHYVQLVSIKEESAAAAEWKKLQATHNVLAPLTMRVQRADLGERGVFYRLQGGPVPEDEARQICKAIQEKKPGGCLVVK